MYQSIFEVPKPRGIELEKSLQDLGISTTDELLMYNERPKLFTDRMCQVRNFAHFPSMGSLERITDLLKSYAVSFDANAGGYDFCNHPIEYTDIAVWNLISDIRSERLFFIHSPVNIYGVLLGVRNRPQPGYSIYNFFTCADCTTKRISEEKHKAKERYGKNNGTKSSRLTIPMVEILPVSGWDDAVNGKHEWEKLRKSIGVRS